MHLLNSKTDFEFLVADKRAAAVHFDAPWDADNRSVTRRHMLEAEEVLAQQVNFGEVDCQANPELATAAHILNVPSVAYYRNGHLVAVTIGAQQNVRALLERVLRGESIGSRDESTGPSHISRKNK